eukprot:1620532-Rhodomonas_salina.1
MPLQNSDLKVPLQSLKTLLEQNSKARSSCRSCSAPNDPSQLSKVALRSSLQWLFTAALQRASSELSLLALRAARVHSVCEVPQHVLGLRPPDPRPVT